MESEGAKRELKWKVIRKEQAIKRVGMLTSSQANIQFKKNYLHRDCMLCYQPSLLHDN